MYWYQNNPYKAKERERERRRVGAQDRGNERRGKWDQNSAFTSRTQSKHFSCVSLESSQGLTKDLITSWKDYTPWHFDICIHTNYLTLSFLVVLFYAKSKNKISELYFWNPTWVKLVCASSSWQNVCVLSQH